MMAQFKIVFCFMLLQAYCTLTCDVKGRLLKSLQKEYSTTIEPNNVTLKFGVAVICSRYDAEDSELTTNVWERYSWSDPRLSWDPKDYEGVNILRLPHDSIWKPDIKLYNSVKANEDRSNAHAVVKSDGNVLWIPTATYKTLCANGNGSISCSLKLGSWTYDTYSVDMQPSEQGPADIEHYLNATCPMQVVKFSGKVSRQLYPCCKEPYASMEIQMTLKPKPSKF